MDIPAIFKSSIPKAVLKKKGDLATATNDGQLDTMPVGPDGTVLTADSTQTTGFTWGAHPNSSTSWGSITGTLANQTDLENALNGKQNALGFTPVPNTTQVNGHALTTNVTLSNSDVGLGNVSNDAQLTRSAKDFSSFTQKATPVAEDVLLLEDSAASGAKKFCTVGSLPTGTGPGGLTSILKGTGSNGFIAAQAGTDYLAPDGSAATLTDFPILNQNTTGTAANLSGTPTLPNGTAATTQPQADNSPKLATTAYVDTGLSGKLSPTGDGSSLTGLTAAQVGLGNVTNDAQIPQKLVTAKGDLLVATGSAALTSQAVGSDGQFLQADSSQPTGVKWAPAGATSATWGGISGTLANQTDLQSALNGRAPKTDKYDTDYADLTTAIKTLNAEKSEVILHVTTPQTISSSLTVNSNLNLQVHRGAIITINPGETLTINSSLEAGPYQIFNWTPLIPTVPAVNLQYVTCPLGTVNIGDRFIIGASGLSAPFTGKPYYIAEYNGGTVTDPASWTFTQPTAGMVVYINNLGRSSQYNGSVWITELPVRFTLKYGASDKFLLRWWGAKGDGTTNDTGAITMAIASILGGMGGLPYYPGVGGKLAGTAGDTYLVDRIPVAPPNTSDPRSFILEGYGCTFQQNSIDHVLDISSGGWEFRIAGWNFLGWSRYHIWQTADNTVLASAPSQVYFGATLGTQVTTGIQGLTGANQWYYDTDASILYYYYNNNGSFTPPANVAYNTTGNSADNISLSAAQQKYYFAGSAVHAVWAGLSSCPNNMVITDCQVSYFDKAFEINYMLISKIQNCHTRYVNNIIYARQSSINNGANNCNYIDNLDGSCTFGDFAIDWAGGYSLGIRNLIMENTRGGLIRLAGVYGVEISNFGGEANGDFQTSRPDGTPFATEFFRFNDVHGLSFMNSSIWLGGGGAKITQKRAFYFENGTSGVAIQGTSFLLGNSADAATSGIYAHLYGSDNTCVGVSVTGCSANGYVLRDCESGDPFVSFHNCSFNSSQGASYTSVPDLANPIEYCKNPHFFETQAWSSSTGATGANDPTTGHDYGTSFKITFNSVADGKINLSSNLNNNPATACYPVFAFWYKGDPGNAATYYIHAALANGPSITRIPVVNDGGWRRVVGTIGQSCTYPTKTCYYMWFQDASNATFNFWISDITVTWWPTASSANAYADMLRRQQEPKPILPNNIMLNSNLGTSLTYSGATVQGMAAETIAFGDVCYYGSDGQYHKAKADTATTCPGDVIAVGAASAGAPALFLTSGYIRYDSFPTITVGSVVYLSDATAGKIMSTLPSSGHYRQALGKMYDNHVLFFHHSSDSTQIP